MTPAAFLLEARHQPGETGVSFPVMTIEAVVRDLSIRPVRVPDERVGADISAVANDSIVPNAPISTILTDALSSGVTCAFGKR